MYVIMCLSTGYIRHTYLNLKNEEIDDFKKCKILICNFQVQKKAQLY